MLIDSRLYRSRERKSGDWFGGSFLLLVVLAGILAAIIAPRGGQHGLAIERFVSKALVACAALLLMFSVYLLIRSVGIFRKYGNKSLVITSLGFTALALGMLLSYLDLDNSAVTVCVYALFTASIINFRSLDKGQ